MSKFSLIALVVAVAVVVAGCGLIKNKNTGTKTDSTPTSDTSASNIVENGDSVAVDYVGTLEDGTLFDTSIEEKAKAGNKHNPARKYEPLKFVVGGGQMIAGFDEGVVGMKLDETKKLTLPPEKAYGDPNDPKYNVPMNIQTFKLAGIAPEAGKSYDFGGQKARVVSISGDQVIANFAPELAGKTLIFEVTIKSITKAVK
ncbi:MAG TPA: FKBP-type peptidyl-prolyl cis-trans isomerase [Candidatus Absconditabacterales bacterium]|nr:FKBP-type peptidyl-prolyl cis-trans isomerase [Candidatus Absconditabacterales bacterium]